MFGSWLKHTSTPSVRKRKSIRIFKKWLILAVIKQLLFIVFKCDKGSWLTKKSFPKETRKSPSRWNDTVSVVSCEDRWACRGAAERKAGVSSGADTGDAPTEGVYSFHFGTSSRISVRTSLKLLNSWNTTIKYHMKLTISVRNAISLSSAERWEKWRSFSKRCVMWLLQKRESNEATVWAC